MKSFAIAFLLVAASCLAGCFSVPASTPDYAVTPTPAPIHVDAPPIYKKAAPPIVHIIPAARPIAANNAAHVVDVARQAILHPGQVLSAVDNATAIVRGDLTSSIAKVEEGRTAAAWRIATATGAKEWIAAVLFLALGFAAAAVGLDWFKAKHPASLAHVEIAPLVEKVAADAKAEVNALGVALANIDFKAEQLKTEAFDAWRDGKPWLQPVVDEAKAVYADYVAPIVGRVVDSVEVAIGEAKAIITEGVVHIEASPMVVEDFATVEAPGFAVENPAAIPNLIAGDVVPAAAPTTSTLSLKDQLAIAKAKTSSYAYGTPEYIAAFEVVKDLAVKYAQEHLQAIKIAS